MRIASPRSPRSALPRPWRQWRLWLTGLLLAATAPAVVARPFTDHAGRTVQVPEHVERVYTAGHPASILLYTLAPDTLLGWSRRLPDAAADFMPARYFSLPELGRLTGRGGSANVELVLTSRAQVIVDYGALTPTYVSLADAVQAQTGIPYVLLDGSLESTPAAYRSLGELLGRRERAERLAAYAEGALRDARRLREQGAAAPRVYYGRGPEGLQTALRGAINAELLELVGAENVAGGPGRGLADVSLEQVLHWRPDVLLTIDSQFFARVRRDPVWRQLPAVRDGRVYLAPALPFPWFDRPPSVNRLVGIPWLAHLLYADPGVEALRAQVRTFYELFYHHRLTPKQIDALLGAAVAEP